ncbi:murein hydrolase activator EnvC family protein [Eubacterium coprostanoligenes]|uniref:Septal ring factor EnvC, activator of murein hydrolases AmiA and AmiB n=1 Tax=Eubacterium coprostanoligenes TaxID=290054 RepID=A0A1T4JU47_9FIRM|nr:peptidoglycan DD-metalloendopeptidase family protein [Eubacterium coprostanoligenes]SJZ33669.1 Septal ring factor EnvC, activator of murein hydrolases AmiA and AmiB [Eubacterium coprostanoligenes]
MRFNSKKIISLILSLAFAFSVVGGTTSTYAASTSALRDKQKKIQSQIDAAQSKINKLSGQKKDTEEYISALDVKIQALKDKISTLKAEANALQSNIDKVKKNISDTGAQINKIQADIDAKQAEFDKTFDEYCQRLRAMYVSGHASNLEVLLTSSDISSILTRSEMIKSVSQKDSKTLNDLMDKMNEIEKDKAELEQKRAQLNKDKEKLQSQKDKLDSNIATVNASKKELDKEVSEANAMMRKLNSQTAEYKESISDNEEEMARIEAQIAEEIRKAQAANTGSTSGSYGSGAYSGTLGYPTNSRRISASYPNYSSGRYHGGVDFPVPSGSAVYAAASGTVIIAKNLNYSYGHYLVVDHGNGLSTLYAHNTTLLVGVGSHVTKGQVIARSGSTGNSTGPHCHFEVRVNGTRVNPFNYL